jgi:CBS domain-containing protein
MSESDGAAGVVADPLQRLFPVVDAPGGLLGVVPRQALVGPDRAGADLGAILVADPVTVHADDTLRTVAALFAQHAVTAAPVTDRAHSDRLVGLITVDHLLDGRLRDLAEEHHRERLITTPRWTPRHQRRPRILARPARGRHED